MGPFLGHRIPSSLDLACALVLSAFESCVRFHNLRVRNADTRVWNVVP